MKRTILFAISAQAVTVVVLLVLAFQLFYQINSLKQFSDKVEHTYLVINQISKVQSAIKDAETSSRGYLLTADTGFLRQMSAAVAQVLPAKDSLHRLLFDSPRQSAVLKKIDRKVFEKVAMMIENTHLKHRIPLDSINSRLSSGKAYMDSIDTYLAYMRTVEMKLLSERRELKKHSELLLPRYSQIAFIIAVLLTLIFGLWIFVELKKRFRYQHLLQVKLTELRQNNEELEQIAFAASHDLQEPLRKIRIFSDRLLLKNKDKAGDEYLMMQRMNFAAARLQDLIGDLVIFNNLVQNRYGLHPVAIKDVLSESIMEIKKVYPNIDILWNAYEELPVVTTTKDQVKILFHQVLSNSIQFKSPDRPLVISIKSSRIPWFKIRGLPSEMNEGNFCQVSINDNGIGFDESFKGKMFMPFQRLHNVENINNTRRKGMGLAMCKRVMLNVGGWIDAEGKVGEGATILLYFPVT